MAAVLMRVYLGNVVNVSASTARVMTNQGLDDFDTITNFTEDYMKTLCVSIRRPGGLVANLRAANPGQPAELRNPGHVVSLISEKRLLLPAFAAHHLARISHPINPVSMTRVYITSLSPLREQE